VALTVISINLKGKGDTVRTTDYQYELLHSGLARRSYANSFPELVDVLIPGYLTMSPSRQMEARLEHAVRAQVLTQAHLNMAATADLLTDDELAVVSGPRHEPPSVALWDAPIPLVLVRQFYTPHTDLAAPEDPSDNLLWIDAGSAYDLIMSLHHVGIIQLHERIPAGV
jgi:hypothetical protein